MSLLRTCCQAGPSCGSDALFSHPHFPTKLFISHLLSILRPGPNPESSQQTINCPNPSFEVQGINVELEHLQVQCNLRGSSLTLLCSQAPLSLLPTSHLPLLSTLHPALAISSYLCLSPIFHAPNPPISPNPSSRSLTSTSPALESFPVQPQVELSISSSALPQPWGGFLQVEGVREKGRNSPFIEPTPRGQAPG